MRDGPGPQNMEDVATSVVEAKEGDLHQTIVEDPPFTGDQIPQVFLKPFSKWCTLS